jgi:hypothetical protein
MVVDLLHDQEAFGLLDHVDEGQADPLLEHWIQVRDDRYGVVGNLGGIGDQYHLGHQVRIEGFLLEEVPCILEGEGSIGLVVVDCQDGVVVAADIYPGHVLFGIKLEVCQEVGWPYEAGGGGEGGDGDLLALEVRYALDACCRVCDQLGFVAGDQGLVLEQLAPCHPRHSAGI